MTQQRTLVLGSPGTGKTTRLLDLVDAAIARGVSPERIAFVGFSRQAADEARGRAMERFNLPTKALPHFRTLHSLAFRGLGLTRERVLGKRHLVELEGLVGEQFTGRFDETQPTLGGSGDALLFLEQYARTTRQPLRRAWEEQDAGMDYHRLARFAAAYAGYKRDTGALDFTDMLERYVAEGEPLSVDLAIVDEAQDLTLLQWAVAHRALGGAKELWAAGDDDQSIHRWAGAATEHFLGLDWAQEVLPTSHRLPRRIFELAAEVAGRLSRRFAKTWRPSAREGTVEWVGSPDEADLGAGTWLLLARTRAQLARLAGLARARGVVYAARGRPAVDPDQLAAIRAHEDVRAGRPIAAALAAAVLSFQGHPVRGAPLPDRPHARAELEARGGRFDRIWHDALTAMPLGDREYYLACRRNGEKLSAPPRVRVETIHGSKGAEADRVLILPDLTPRVARGLELDPDAEHRVFYVGVTRAREALLVARAAGPLAYPL